MIDAEPAMPPPDHRRGRRHSTTSLLQPVSRVGGSGLGAGGLGCRSSDKGQHPSRVRGACLKIIINHFATFPSYKLK